MVHAAEPESVARKQLLGQVSGLRIQVVDPVNAVREKEASALYRARLPPSAVRERARSVTGSEKFADFARSLKGCASSSCSCRKEWAYKTLLQQ